MPPDNRVLKTSANHLIFLRGALAHDLNEPVRTIQSFSSLLEEQANLDSEQMQYLRYIAGASQHMKGLLESVADYTRLDAEDHIETEHASFVQLMENVQVNLQRLIEKRGAHITHDKVPNITVNILQMTRVLQNLIANAIRYCPEGKTPNIHIGYTLQEQNVQLSIADNGNGIKEGFYEDVFAPFRRLVGRKVEGTGLGLAICRKIVGLHGGKIWCENGPSGGAVFYLTIPAAEDGANISPQMPETSPDTIDSVVRPASDSLANVLVVDDSAVDIRLLQIMLMNKSHMQFNLFSVNDGEQALRWLQDEANPTIDLVLLDINMPGMDGFDVLKNIRTNAAFCTIPVCMLSTSADENDKARAKALGATSYMTKPADIKQFEQLLHITRHLVLVKEGEALRLMKVAA